MEERKRVNELKHGIAQKKAATAIQARGSFVHLHKLPAVYMKLLSLLCSALVQLLHAVALIRMNAAIFSERGIKERRAAQHKKRELLFYQLIRTSNV